MLNTTLKQSTKLCQGTRNVEETVRIGMKDHPQVPLFGVSHYSCTSDCHTQCPIERAIIAWEKMNTPRPNIWVNLGGVDDSESAEDSPDLDRVTPPSYAGLPPPYTPGNQPYDPYQMPLVAERLKTQRVSTWILALPIWVLTLLR